MGNCLFQRRQFRVEPETSADTVNNESTDGKNRTNGSVYENFIVVKRKEDEVPGDSSIITEFSAKHLLNQVIRDFQEKEDLDLSIVGNACRTRKAAARDKIRQEEARVLKMLKEEGLPSSPQKQSSWGITYDLGQSLDARSSKPVRLAKLESTRRHYLTEEQIKLKLEMAEERTQEEEKKKILKIKKESEQIRKGFAKEMERKREIEELRRKKMENVSENREQRLEAIRKRMQEREEHRERVRKMKEISLDSLDPA